MLICETCIYITRGIRASARITMFSLMNLDVTNGVDLERWDDLPLV
jgi:hypothetical protein